MSPANRAARYVVITGLLAAAAALTLAALRESASGELGWAAVHIIGALAAFGLASRINTRLEELNDGDL